MKYKNIIKPVAFVLGLLILLKASSFFFVPRDNKNNYYGMVSRGFYSEPKNSLDYLVIGDSASVTSISPMVMWEKYGYVGYNCGCPSYRVQEVYYLLEELLEYQSPKIVLLETNAFYRNKDIAEEMIHVSDIVFGKYFPVIKYHDMWKYFGKDTIKEIKDGPNFTWSDPLKGVVCNNRIDPYEDSFNFKKTDKEYKINAVPLYFIDKITELCKEKGIELILYTTPSPLCWTYEKHNSAAEYAQKNNLKLVDMNLCVNDVGIDWKSDTKDKGNHVNYSGTIKVTNYVGRYLSENCSLEDHRGDPEYASWDKIKPEYEKAIK